ncbi:MAG TPA: amino acid permease, partial [Longimicrobiales bacterium]|nr:amino acid permease [Longimicrobiales bacterium]
VVFSTFGALSGIVLMGPRVYYRMARDGLLFRWLAAVHPRHRTPHRAIWLQGAWAVVLLLTGTYRELFTRVIYTEWIFFGLMAVGLLVLRRREGYAAGYRVPGGALVPAAFALSAAVIVASQVVRDPGESAVGLGFVLLGVPAYVLARRIGTPEEPGEETDPTRGEARG